MSRKINNYRIVQLAILIIGLALFWYIKVPHLFLPGYWDEAWSYLPAVKGMYDTSIPGLWPGVIPAELSKGHPLFFYFIEAVWLKFWGFSLPAAKLLALLITTAMLTAIYHLGDKKLGKDVGLFAALILMAHGMVIAQSTLVLPEMAMTLFVLMAAFSYLDKKYVSTAVWMLMAVLTKESALIISGALGLHFIIDNAARWKSTSLRDFLKHGLILAIPIIAYGLFLVWQHSLYGWWFYPDHVARMELTWKVFEARMEVFSQILFINNNFIWLTLLFGISLVFVVIQKVKLNLQFVSIATIIVLIFMIFSSVNFFSDRYLLVLLPFIVLGMLHVILKTFPKAYIRLPAIVILIFLVGWKTHEVRSISDANPWHVQMIKMHEAAIDTMIKKHHYNSKIASEFLIEYYTENPVAGYVNDSTIFSDISGWYRSDVSYVINSSSEYTPAYDSIRQNHPNLTWARWEDEIGWVEIYDLRKIE